MKERVNYKKQLFILIFLSVAFFCLDSAVTAQTRRAFLVGINNYEPKGPVKKPLCRKVGDVKNLSGSVNDVMGMKGILVSRFYFKPGNIRVLINEQATRHNILSGIENHLIKDAAPGDVCVFYFAGHGSRVKNSMSGEPDKKDETLVPADWYRGVGDIRDKELKRLFNRILDKKVHLTVIVDACHSGSISRGSPVRLHYRWVPENECDAADPPGKEKDPVERGALVLSAARDFQLAREKTDENNTRHGLFTWALLRVLRSVPFDEPAGSIFSRVNALMQGESMTLMVKTRDPSLKLHDPNLEAAAGSRNKPLFGAVLGRDLGIAVPVMKIREKRIFFNAGFAEGIRENCELREIAKPGDRPLVRVRVTRVYGLNLCESEVIRGDAGEIEPGDLFEIYKWVASRESAVKVWIPGSNFSHDTLLDICRETAALRDSDRLEWVEDPTKVTPTHTMSWYGSSWRIEIGNGRIIELGKRPKANLVLKKVTKSRLRGNRKPRFFLHLPLGPEMMELVAPEIDYYKDSVKVVSSGREADYLLAGRYNRDKITYAWVRTGMTGEGGEWYDLPAGTGWISLRKEGRGYRKGVLELWDGLLRLIKIRAWMKLSSPPDRGRFPYRPVLKNTKTGETTTRGPLIEGDVYGMVLRSYKEKPGRDIHGRYVYVFSINNDGKGTLLFPPAHRMNSENYFPVDDEFQREIQLWDKGLFRIGKPFGVDTYFLLAAEEPISNPKVLDFKGVRREPLTGEGYTSLERLLYGLGSDYRGRVPRTYTNWSIHRLFILSKPK